MVLETGEDGAIVFTEQWQTVEALQAHLRSHIFLRVLGAMELLRFTPEVMFFDVSEAGGMEQIELARGGDRVA